MRLPSGTAAFFAGMRQPEPDQAAFYLLSGDLNQMGIMEDRLRAAGFPVVRSQSGTYPGFRKQDKDRFVEVLRHLFEHRVPGWWGQSDKMIEHGVCTEQEYRKALAVECER